MNAHIPNRLLPLLTLPVLAMGFTSCSSVQQMQDKMNARIDTWQEQREERRIKKELAKLQQLPELPEAELGRPGPAFEPPVFLDYENPDRGVVAQTRRQSDQRAGFAISGGMSMDDLPSSVSEFTNTVAVETSGPGATRGPIRSLPTEAESFGHQGMPIFRDDVEEPALAAAPTALDPALVQTWARTFVPVVAGATLTEPLLTAALTTAPPAAVEAPATRKAAILANLTAEQFSTAAAFAGRPAVETTTPTSEYEHQSVTDNGPQPAPVAVDPAAR